MSPNITRVFGAVQNCLNTTEKSDIIFEYEIESFVMQTDISAFSLQL